MVGHAGSDSAPVYLAVRHRISEPSELLIPSEAIFVRTSLPLPAATRGAAPICLCRPDPVPNFFLDCPLNPAYVYIQSDSTPVRGTRVPILPDKSNLCDATRLGVGLVLDSMLADVVRRFRIPGSILGQTVRNQLGPTVRATYYKASPGRNSCLSLPGSITTDEGVSL